MKVPTPLRNKRGIIDYLCDKHIGQRPPPLSPWLINTAPQEETLQKVGTPAEEEKLQEAGTPPAEAETPEEEKLQEAGTPPAETETPQGARTTAAETAWTQRVSRKVRLEVGLEVRLEMSRKPT
jgi:hypothetical protein